MRYGDFEVLLQLRNDESGSDDEVVTLQEKQIGKKTYAIAEPDNEYIVKVIVHRNILKKFIANHLRIGVYVDGVDCNYWKRIDTNKMVAADPATCTTFKGFKIGADELRAFVFASPKVLTNRDAGATPLESAGSVRVDVYECVSDEGIFKNRSKKYITPTGSQVAPDAKFYQQPSVTTTSGRNVNTLEKFEPLVRWKNKAKLGSFVLHYHTKEVIDFLVDARCKNINLHMKDTIGVKRAASSVVVDLTGNGDTDADAEATVPSSEPPVLPNSGSISEKESMYSLGEAQEKTEGEDDDDIQHVPMIKHIPCIDISQDTSERVSYIKKEL
jgi:hypothetical protein